MIVIIIIVIIMIVTARTHGSKTLSTRLMPITCGTTAQGEVTLA